MTTYTKRSVLALSAAFGMTALMGAGAAQAEWPKGDIRIIVPYAPGGTSDNVARAVVPALEEILAVKITIENIGGAGGTIGMTRLAKGQQDGTLFGITPNGALTIAPNMRPVSYDPLKDVVPVAHVADAIGMLAVRQDFPADDMEGLIAYMKEHPGEVTFGSSGIGAVTHINVELFQESINAQAAHVPFKGSGEAVNNLLGGHVDALFDYSPLLAQVQAESVKPIAMMKKERWQGLPDVPVLNEVGYDAPYASLWYGVLAPLGTSDEAIQGMEAAMAKAVEMPEVKKRFDMLGLVSDYADANAFGEKLTQEHAFFADTLKRLKLDRN